MPTYKAHTDRRPQQVPQPSAQDRIGGYSFLKGGFQVRDHTWISSLIGLDGIVSAAILDLAGFCSSDKLQTTGRSSSRSTGALDVAAGSSDSEPEHSMCGKYLRQTSTIASMTQYDTFRPPTCVNGASGSARHEKVRAPPKRKNGETIRTDAVKPLQPLNTRFKASRIGDGAPQQ